MSEQKLKLDKEEIEGVIYSAERLVSVMKDVINELKNYKDNDVFSTYMYYSKLKSMLSTQKFMGETYDFAVKIGHNIMAPQLDTPAREENEWNKFKIDKHDMFEQATDQDDDQESDEALKEFLSFIEKKIKASTD